MSFAPLADIELYYEETGAGEPLLISTGWALAERAFVQHRELFARHYRCIRHDHRNMGRSGAPPAETSIAQMADDLAGLLDHLGIDRTRVLGGGGMGALVGLELAIRHPSRVRSLHLGAPCLAPDAFLKSMLAMWGRLRRLDKAMWAEEVTHWCYTPATFAANPAMARDAARARTGEPTFPSDDAYDRILRAYAAYDARGRTGGIRCPVQISNGGEHDLITGPRMAREVHEAIPGSEFVVFENGSHNYWVEDQPRFGAMILDWFGRT